LIADHQDPLQQAADGRLHALEAVDHDRARRAALDGVLRDAVDVRVIEVETGRFVDGEHHVI
jgi:hypothetical protein